VKPPKITNQIINKLEKANSFIIRLIPHSFFVCKYKKQVLCQPRKVDEIN
jgi:hypothetical protein